MKLAAVGAIATATAKFYFGKEWSNALFIGMAAIAVAAIITWPDTTPNP